MRARSTFQRSVLSDEITQDFGRAAEIAARDFGLGYVELRAMWGKNVTRLDATEVAEVRRVLEKYRLRVSMISGPLFKIDWPDAPVSPFREGGPSDYSFDQQADVLERETELARVFRTSHVRCFDFWRLADPAPHRAAIDDALRAAAEKVGSRGMTLILENEYACNTATGAEAGRVLNAVKTPSFKLNWDPGNAAFRDETPYPDGFSKIPVDRIAHLHCKDASRDADGRWQWEAMGRGVIEWVGQFRALRLAGYRGPATLETHWQGLETPEASSRASMVGMNALLRRAGALT